ncbi:uncharacterized protein N7496_009117 [Penicillium cataractarum]|uniref:Subtelomeric hrmA-associated cluster protein AFUB-079030/YDR124W-like helical bundle domain-containing protein n=1 Tax=Penicillium cataractarum TaxID=2100454 RepID=A0A9W9V5D8_9EURO|nr:uncharacterized protein N7496_009117 [Penicillium cataractarum]KAJ5369357.1 hypothetical protein N7496_009117 [Penicillium cataractarum]
MYRLNSQQQLLTSAEPDARMIIKPVKMKQTKRPRRKLSIWTQEKDYHWQTNTFQTDNANLDQFGPIAYPFSQGSKYDNGTFPTQDSKAMVQRYENAFANFQQTNCRVLAKAYIKILEPRKQVNYPYNGRKLVGGRKIQFDPEQTKPPWWPSLVRHHEPDHLPKTERIRLLIHIVRELRVSHGITVDTLREADRSIRDQIRPRSKFKFLEEVYNLREAEEWLLSGQIGNTLLRVIVIQEANFFHIGKQLVKQTSSPEVSNKIRNPSSSGLSGCADIEKNKMMSVDNFASDCAHLSHVNNSFTSFTQCGTLQRLTTGQDENCHDQVVSFLYSREPYIPFHVTPPQWGPGSLQASSDMAAPYYPPQFPYWYESANALAQSETHNAAHYFPASRPLLSNMPEIGRLPQW